MPACVAGRPVLASGRGEVLEDAPPLPVLHAVLANPGVALTWWDQAAWAERLGYAQQDASLSAGLFRALRESNLRLLESVPRPWWVECYGVHEVRGRQTVEEFVRLEAAHDLNHLRQIDRILDSRPR